MKQKSALFFLFSTLFVGCGPIGAHSSIAKAHIAVEAAQAVEADRYAVYEYSKATFYLRKAKEEEGFSSFQEAIDFARNAKSFADAARGAVVVVAESALNDATVSGTPSRSTAMTRWVC